MIANVSPAHVHSDETYNTLKYANRAKNIKTKTVQNSIDIDSHMSYYPKLYINIYDRIAALRAEVQSLRSSLPSDEEEALFDALMKQVQDLQLKLADKQADKSECEHQLVVNESRLKIYILALERLPNDSKLHNLVKESIDKTEASNVLLKHNKDSAERAILRYETKLQSLESSVSSPILQARIDLASSVMINKRMKLQLETEANYVKQSYSDFNNVLLKSFAELDMTLLVKALMNEQPLQGSDESHGVVAYDSSTEDEGSICASEAEDEELSVSLFVDENSFTINQPVILDCSMSKVAGKSEPQLEALDVPNSNTCTPKQPRNKPLEFLEDETTPRQKKVKRNTPLKASIRKARHRQMRQSMIPIMNSRLLPETPQVIKSSAMPQTEVKKNATRRADTFRSELLQRENRTFSMSLRKRK
jgi:hypothetical protein